MLKFTAELALKSLDIFRYYWMEKEQTKKTFLFKEIN